MPRNNPERLSSAEQAIEQETLRIIRDHLPTVYSISLKRKPELCCLDDEKEVDQHIRYFFSCADQVIGRVGQELELPKSVINEFKLDFRKLYTVASIESHLKAIELGRAKALRMAGGDENGILAMSTPSNSGRLMKDSAKLAFTTNPYERFGRKIKVILLTDDASHSGAHLVNKLWNIRDDWPYTPIVVAVGTITKRALERFSDSPETNWGSGSLRPIDALVYSELRLSLRDMFEQIPSLSKRQQMYSLAEKFFASQNQLLRRGLKATHLITPFKLPDFVSNGELAQILLNGEKVCFTMRAVETLPDSLYPRVL